MPCIKSDALGRSHGRLRNVGRCLLELVLCVFDFQGKAKPSPNPRPGLNTPSNGARVQVKPHAGGGAPDQAQVTRPGRCRAGSQGAGVGSWRGCGAPPWSAKVLTGTPGWPGGAKLPANLHTGSCTIFVTERSGAGSKERCGGASLHPTTGYRGVDVTFVNVYRRLYRTHPGQLARWCLSTYAHLRVALIPALC
jgi:hypothetical protein